MAALPGIVGLESRCLVQSSWKQTESVDGYFGRNQVSAAFLFKVKYCYKISSIIRTYIWNMEELTKTNL